MFNLLQVKTLAHTKSFQYPSRDGMISTSQEHPAVGTSYGTINNCFCGVWDIRTFLGLPWDGRSFLFCLQSSR